MTNVSSLRERILESDDIQKEIIYVKEWNVNVAVWGLSAGDRSKLINRVMDHKNGDIDMQMLYPLLIQECARDPESQERIFTKEDLPRLNTKAASALEKIGDKAAELSGMKKEKNEDLGKPSSLSILDSTPSEDSL